MENYIKELSDKMDKILTQQELILNTLENKVILESTQTNFKQKKKTKQQEKQELENYYTKLIEESFALAPHKSRLQQQFNLATKPHANRVKAYLKTKDESVFDGLLRNY